MLLIKLINLYKGCELVTSIFKKEGSILLLDCLKLNEVKLDLMEFNFNISLSLFLLFVS